MRNLLIICGLALLVYGCGKDGGGSGTANTGIAGSCGIGQVYTQQYGCLSQGQCAVGQGYHPQVGCVQGSITNQNQFCPVGQVSTQYGCLSQGQCGFGQGYHPQYGCIQGQMQNQWGSQWGSQWNQWQFQQQSWMWSYPMMQWQWGYPNSRCQVKSWYWYCY